LLGSVSGELGLRKFLEGAGHTLVVTSDKDGPNSVFEKELPDAEVVISQPFWPAYMTKERFDKAKKLKLVITAGIGSDHTDRKAETVGVSLSKQMCAKPVSAAIWRHDDVAPHWDKLILRSFARVGGDRRLYQEGPVAGMRPPPELIGLYTDGGSLPQGSAMFCGTLAVHGGIAAADTFEMELEDPVLRRIIRHSYTIATLPIEG